MTAVISPLRQGKNNFDAITERGEQSGSIDMSVISMVLR